MKVFTEPEGKFAVKVPIEWEYQNELVNADSKTPHSFELYDNSTGCYQISCNDKKIGNFPKLTETYQLKEQEIGTTGLEFTEKVIFGDKFDMHLWMAVVGEEFFLVKYICDSDKREEQVIKDEIEKSKKTLSSIVFIKPNDRASFIASDRFDKFMASMAACIDLSNRAIENKSFIELVILISNHIDALLRLAIILTKQLEKKNSDIDTSLIYQKPGDKPVMEKTIYKTALNSKIISQKLYDELFEIYNERNKVVHRYIITDLKTRDVIKIVLDLGDLQDKVGIIVEELEKKQYDQDIGIYNKKNQATKKPDADTIRKIVASVRDKHGSDEVNKEITIHQ